MSKPSNATVLLAFFLAHMPVFAQTPGSLRGTITDDSGSVVPGAKVRISGPGVTKNATTNVQGLYTVPGLPAGNYTVRVTMPGFTTFETAGVPVGTSQAAALNVTLKIATEQQQVTVQGDATTTVSVDPTQNVGQLVLREAEIDALPDDPDDLLADLQALAGPSAGPNGGEIYIDGFTGGRLPPKESIREIRINQNPFSAEYDKVGFGRIEILTKPGSDKFRGQVFFNDSDAVFNSRNPYATNKPDFFNRQYGGNVSGPLSKRASFFFDFEARDIDDNAIVAAQILNPDLSVGLLHEGVLVPNRRYVFSPRLDYQISTNNTLVARYSFQRSNEQNAGIGVFDLPVRAYHTTNNEDSIQVTETSVIGTKVVNETRFRAMRDATSSVSDNTAPAILVSQAFDGGGPQVGDTYQNEKNFEITNITSVLKGVHAVKFGMRSRTDMLESVSPQNFGGTFVYNTGVGPELGPNNAPVLDSSGNPVEVTLTSLVRYQRTLMLQNAGSSPAQIIALGGGASQFSIAAGNPKATVSQTDLSPFIQDDWRLRPNLTLSLGLRYEWQNTLSDHKDWAPRLGIAWSPDSKGGRPGKTVIRLGTGFFYDRFADTAVLNSIRFNGLNQQDYIIQNPAFLTVPAISSLPALPQTVYKLDPTLRAPYIIQTALGLERQLPKNTVLGVNFIDSHGLHELLARNINAPLPGTFTPSPTLVPGGSIGIQPFGTGNIYQYESAGLFNQNQIMINVRTQFSAKVSMFGYYTYGRANSTEDGSSGFPANQYTLGQDYGRSSLDQRHRVVLSGSITTKWALRWSPFIIIHSGAPFNITTGRDPYDNSFYTERPSFATSCGGPNIVCNKFGMFNLNPAPGAALIPRNYGNGPAYYSVNLRLSKTWGFGEPRAPRTNPNGGGRDRGLPGGGFGSTGGPGGSRGGGGGGGRSSGGGRGGGRGGSSSDLTNHRYNVTASIYARNLLNTVNPGTPIGNLGSPLFGESNQISSGFGPTGQSANNRRLEMSLRFSF